MATEPLTEEEREALVDYGVAWLANDNPALHNAGTERRLAEAEVLLLRRIPRLTAPSGREVGEVERLREFAAWVMSQHTGSIDGCEIEEEAVRLGLMEMARCDGSCEDCSGAIPGEDNCFRPLLPAPSAAREDGP